MKNGYAGKILWVDLSSEKIHIETSEHYQGWIGGRGLAVHLLVQLPELKSEKPEEQPVVVAAGPAVGTGIPLATRTSVSARNLISGGISYSNVGGNFGATMKSAGFDAVVIRGFSQRPVYLLFKEGQASIKPANELWGLQVSDVRDMLDKIYGNGQTSFIGIGQGGENLVPVSCLIVDRAHAAGWGGSGWIFGAKLLKAIVAVGKSSVEVAHPRLLQKKVKELEWRLNSSEAMAGLIRGGHMEWLRLVAILDLYRPQSRIFETNICPQKNRLLCARASSGNGKLDALGAKGVIFNVYMFTLWRRMNLVIWKLKECMQILCAVLGPIWECMTRQLF